VCAKIGKGRPIPRLSKKSEKLGRRKKAHSAVESKISVTRSHRGKFKNFEMDGGL